MRARMHNNKTVHTSIDGAAIFYLLDTEQNAVFVVDTCAIDGSQTSVRRDIQYNSEMEEGHKECTCTHMMMMMMTTNDNGHADDDHDGQCTWCTADLE